LVSFVLMTAGVAAAQKPEPRACVVLQPLDGSAPPRQSGECGVRLSPASTYKIPHALIALETGAVAVDTLEKWDGTRYERQPKWNLNHTVISALRPSVLWFFQRVAPRIGAERAAAWLARFEYGNQKVTGPITQYWVDGSLAISPLEQVIFLRRFYQKALPVQQRYVDAIRGGLEQDRGTVENSLGIHTLEGKWTGAKLNAKTGATTTADYRVSWLVGLLTVDDRDHVFASAVWNSGTVDTLDAAGAAARAFIRWQLVPER
jgi:beta-lactamase class D